MKIILYIRILSRCFAKKNNNKNYFELELGLKNLFQENRKGNTIVFGKKKLPGIPVQHYEGLDFAVDYPCRVELSDKAFIITRIKPETTVTLPIAQIKSFSTMEEERFMLQYHGERANTSKVKEIKKYYLIVKYTSKSGEDRQLVFWGTAGEYGKFLQFQNTSLNTSSSYTL